MVTTSGSPHQSVLRGTPVVPGVAHAPVQLVRSEVSPEAIARFDANAYDEDSALAAYDDAIGAVADGFAAKAAKASGAAAEVLTASAGLARDKGLRGSFVAAVRMESEDLAPEVGTMPTNRVAEMRYSDINPVSQQCRGGTKVQQRQDHKDVPH